MPPAIAEVPAASGCGHTAAESDAAFSIPESEQAELLAGWADSVHLKFRFVCSQGSDSELRHSLSSSWLLSGLAGGWRQSQATCKSSLAPSYGLSIRAGYHLSVCDSASKRACSPHEQLRLHGPILLYLQSLCAACAASARASGAGCWRRRR